MGCGSSSEEPATTPRGTREPTESATSLTPPPPLNSWEPSDQQKPVGVRKASSSSQGISMSGASDGDPLSSALPKPKQEEEEEEPSTSSPGGLHSPEGERSVGIGSPIPSSSSLRRPAPIRCIVDDGEDSSDDDDPANSVGVASNSLTPDNGQRDGKRLLGGAPPPQGASPAEQIFVGSAADADSSLEETPRHGAGAIRHPLAAEAESAGTTRRTIVPTQRRTSMHTVVTMAPNARRMSVSQ